MNAQHGSSIAGRGFGGLLLAILAYLWMAVGSVAMAAPSLSISDPQTGATVSDDHVTVVGTATAIGGGQGIDLMVVMDDSGSLTSTDPARDRFNALRSLMNSFGPGANIQVGLVFFASSASVSVNLSDVSTATGLINGAISARGGPSGATAIGSGIRSAIDQFSAHGRSGATKVMVVFTDGEETMSTNPVGAATDAYAAGIIVNVVDLGGNAANAQIASAGSVSGRQGVVLSASNSQQLADMFRSAQLVGISGVTVSNLTTGQAALSVSMSAGAFTAPIDLAQGLNTIEVTATDAAGVTTSQQLSVTRQGTAPTPTPTRAVKLRPQVLMAGFDPMLIDITDTSFKVLAVVRAGAAGIDQVSVSENTGGFSVAMSALGKLSNDDRVYGLTYTFARGSIPMNTPLANLFGSREGQYNITATDSAQQTHSFPALEFGNNQDVTSAVQLPSASDYTTAGARRGKPQVVMAGVDPILLDYTDTSFKVKAVVRAGTVGIQSVTLQNGSGFANAMNYESDLPNGDKMYAMTLTYPRGSFPATAMRDLWGTANSTQFVVEATDAAQQTHRFPELIVGNYPVQ